MNAERDRWMSSIGNFVAQFGPSPVLDWVVQDVEEMENEMSDMREIDLTGVEEWREYDFGGRVYRIDRPAKVYIGTTTHRVIGADGTVHCLPAPGQQGCVLRWKGAVVA